MLKEKKKFGPNTGPKRTFLSEYGSRLKHMWKVAPKFKNGSGATLFYDDSSELVKKLELIAGSISARENNVEMI